MAQFFEFPANLRILAGAGERTQVLRILGKWNSVVPEVHYLIASGRGIPSVESRSAPAQVVVLFSNGCVKSWNQRDGAISLGKDETFMPVAPVQRVGKRIDLGASSLVCEKDEISFFWVVYQLMR